MKSNRLFDIFLYLGALLLTIAMVTVLFNLKWAQNARKLAMEQEEVHETREELSDDTVLIEEPAAEEEVMLTDVSEVADDSESMQVTEDDVIFFLGGDFSKLQQRFASSEQILGEKSHYFVDEYLGVVYDENTGEIMCLENDGPGKMPIKLAGFSIGMSREELYMFLSDNDIEYTESEEDNTVKFNWHAGDTVKYKAEIEFEDEQIIDIICRVR